MNHTVKRSLNNRQRGSTDWERIDRVTDQEIERAVASDSDAAPLLDEEFWRSAKVVMPSGKTMVSIRLDRDVLDFLKAEGRGYQTRINLILRAYMEYQRKRRKSGE